MEKTLDTKVFDNLEKLQVVLSAKYQIQAKIEDVPKQLETQEELLARLKKEYIEKNSKYEALKEKVDGLKDELEEAVKLREEGEKGMDNISTHREYEALEKQISEASDKEGNLRKELDKEEKNLAELDEAIKADESVIKSQEKDLNEARASLDKEAGSLKKELASLEKKEANISANIDPEITYKFQRIIQRNNEGIVYVKNGVCGGCHMILPAQFALEVREENEILFCPYCSRILRWQETKEGEEEDYFTIDTAGSLSDLDDDADSYDDDDDDISDNDDEIKDDEMLDDEDEDEAEDSDEEEESEE
ncbi:MAG: nucleic acid-binding protein [Treponema sp.]|nr:nucleic acid-binding protein [Treponema sp.]